MFVSQMFSMRSFYNIRLFKIRLALKLHMIHIPSGNSNNVKMYQIPLLFSSILYIEESGFVGNQANPNSYVSL